MPWEVLSERSGLSRATVYRLLSGKQIEAKFGHVEALAKALGVEIGINHKDSVEKMVENQAKQQARRAFKITQGTMGLEAQGINDETVVSQLLEKSMRRFLKCPRRRLWSK